MAAVLALQLLGVPALVVAFVVLPAFVYVTIALWLDPYSRSQGGCSPEGFRQLLASFAS
jgi:hypothetical protein